MKAFTLIKQLQEPEDKAVSPLPPGIKYQLYELDIQGDTRRVYIPLREADAFEEAVQQIEEQLTTSTLSKLLRQFRGIRG